MRMIGDMPFAVVDVETTGFSPLADDRIVEIAIVRVGADGAILDEYVTLINPLRDVGASHAHGISDEDVLQAPTFAEVTGDVLKRLDGSVLVAHNVRFDRDFLSAEFSFEGVFLPAIPSLCTMQLSYRLDPNCMSHRLSSCCVALGIFPEGAHTALGDARATAQLLLAYLRLGQDLGWTTLAALGCSPITFPSALWPHLPSSGRTCVRTGGTVSGNVPYIAQLVAGLESIGCVNERIAPYLDVLDRALEDRQITGDEAAALLAVAMKWGLSREDVLDAHQIYLERLVDAAVANGRVTEFERRDLEAVTRLLAISPAILHSLVTDAMKDAMPIRAQRGKPRT